MHPFVTAELVSVTSSSVRRSSTWTARKYVNLNVTASKTAIDQQENVCKNQKRTVKFAKGMMNVSMAKAAMESTGECG